MGVTGLWPILQPCARPIKLEALNRKRLAVDASIWIYQFLKAVRDKEGNALRNSHVVGFFRRICKLLFFGIKPVFVFDGGAPALKRQTVLGRKRRREGRRDDAVRTAGKLLAVQMQRRIEEDEEKKRRKRDVRAEAVEEQEDEIPADKDLVYVEEIGMSAMQRTQTRKFTKKDAYHLPDLNGNIENMGQPNDPRIMSVEELEEYARQFDNGEDINLYDFSKIDFNGKFFLSLPAGDRYNILNAARLRSRLRMGLSKEQLEGMFPDRMAFSRFQIERVRERNELTQRLMNLNGMNDKDAMFGVTGVGRIAGEKGREYVLVKNDGVEGGWALGVVSREDKDLGDRKKPIDIDALEAKRIQKIRDDDWEDEDEFEDVPIEGLNRLPKIKNYRKAEYDCTVPSDMSKERRQLYPSRQRHHELENPDSMFVNQTGEDHNSRQIDDLFEEDGYASEQIALDHTLARSLDMIRGSVDSAYNSEEEALNRAIAMSLEKDTQTEDPFYETEEAAVNHAIAMSLDKQYGHVVESEDEDMEFENVKSLNFQQRAAKQPKPLSRGSGKMVAHLVNNRANAAVPKRKGIFEDSDDDMDLQAPLASSSKQGYQAPKRPRVAPAASNQKNPFDGPLPFESLNFKTSLFTKKKAAPKTNEEKLEEDGQDDHAGGFQVDDEESSKPLPPWMVESGDIRSDMEQQRTKDAELNAADREQAEEDRRIFMRDYGVIHVESSDEDSDVEVFDERPLGTQEKQIDLTGDSTKSAKPMSGLEAGSATKVLVDIGALRPVDHRQEDLSPSSTPTNLPKSPPKLLQPPNEPEQHDSSNEEPIDWSDSDREDGSKIAKIFTADLSSANKRSTSVDRSLSQTEDDGDNDRPNSPLPEFEDVQMPDTRANLSSSKDDEFNRQEAEIVSDVDFDEFSDPEDEELLAQLATEAEEHARFASTLNNKSEQENKAAYERELKALRNQQKKDRRDADEVSHIMITECQTLLRLFGIPYITAPMEAEAQCAELVRLGLVDGIVTDDSDCLLFEGTRVYKNMFNGNKFVECYLKSDIERELTLSRHHLIAIAHLLGSDYTEGLIGIGPVTALEILSEFPSENGLQEFKDWWADVQSNKRTKEEDAKSPFRKKFRKAQGTKLFLPPAFPSLAVTEAYLNPDVDCTPEAFQWGVPDLDNLRAFLMSTIGWTQERTDEVLVPVIRDMNRRATEGTQTNITRYFEGGVGAGATPKESFAPRVRDTGSVRMKEAVKKLRAKTAKSGSGPLEGTFGDEAARWVKKNELSDAAYLAKQSQKKAERGKRNAPPSSPEAEEGVAEDENGDEGDDESTEEYRDTGNGKRRTKRRKRSKALA